MVKMLCIPYPRDMLIKILTPAVLHSIDTMENCKNGRHFAIFSKTFYSQKIFALWFRFHPILFSLFQLIISQHSFRWCSGSVLIKSYYLLCPETHSVSWMVNTLAPGRLIAEKSHEITLRWLSQNVVQVMAWCHQAWSHCLSQCLQRSISPYGWSLGHNDLRWWFVTYQ